MNKNKTILFNEFLDKLNDCTAVMVDGGLLCYPYIPMFPAEFDFRIETEYAEEFFNKDENPSVTVRSDGVAELVNSRGEKTTFVLLNSVVL